MLSKWHSNKASNYFLYFPVLCMSSWNLIRNLTNIWHHHGQSQSERCPTVIHSNSPGEICRYDTPVCISNKITQNLNYFINPRKHDMTLFPRVDNTSYCQALLVCVINEVERMVVAFLFFYMYWIRIGLAK